MHKWLPQQIFHIFYRTVNKYEFIKPQYLFRFFLFYERNVC